MKRKNNSSLEKTYYNIMKNISIIVKKAINEAINNTQKNYNGSDINSDETDTMSNNLKHSENIYYPDINHYNDIFTDKRFDTKGVIWFDKNFKITTHTEIKTLFEYVDNFNIDSLPEYIRKDIYNKDYYDIDFNWDIDECYSESYNEVINEDFKLPTDEMSKLGVAPKIKINENVYITPAYKIASELESKYGVFLRSVKVEHINKKMKNRIIKIEFLPQFLNTSFVVLSSAKDIKNDKNITNLDIIDKDCYSHGYYRIRTSKKVDKNGQEFYMSIYNPVKDEPINFQLHRVFSLFHLAPIELRDDIKETGIITNSGGRTYTYKEPRAFFAVGDYYDQDYLKMMKGIFNKNKKNGNNFSGEYDIWQIETRKLPKDITFYLDPNEDNCVFAKVPINIKHLKLYGTIDLNNFYTLDNLDIIYY